MLVGVAAAGLAWLWHSDGAWQRAAALLPGLTLEGAAGRPMGGPFALRRLQWEGGGTRVLVEGLAWDDASWSWRPHAGAWLALALQRPRAARVQVLQTAPPPAPAAPLQAPASLQLPLEVRAPGLRIGSIELPGQVPLTDVAADLHIGAAAGEEHRVEQLKLTREGLLLTGRAVIGTRGALPLQAQLDAATVPDAATARGAQVSAELRAEGPLRRLDLRARLAVAAAGAPGAGAEADVQATLAPFAPWPVLALAAQARNLDLSTLAPGAPATRLSGRAVLAEAAAAQGKADPLAVELALDNAEPGPWDTGRVPLRSLQLRLQASPAEPGRYTFDRLEARLAGVQAAGTVQGSGSWQGRRLALALQLQGVQPERLHTAAPPMQLNGRTALTLNGLAAPGATPDPAAAPGLAGTLEAELQGRPARRGAPALALQAAAQFALPADGSLQFTLARAQARAGTQAADATASAERSAGGSWRVQSRGSLQRVDPGLWWPAAAGGRGPQALNGRWTADLSWDGGAAAPLAERLRGQASLNLDDSRWAGLAWRGQAALQADARALQGRVDLRAGNNRLQGSGSRLHGSTALQGQAELQAPELAALAPLARLLPAAATAWWPQAGTLEGQARFEGTPAALRSDGTLRAQGLRSPALALARADMRWQLATGSADAPLQLELQAAELAWGQRRLDSLNAKMSGSLRAHVLELKASSPLRPPAWTETVAGVPGPEGSALELQGSGAWTASGAGGTWRGRLASLRAAPRSAPAAPWLAAEGLQATLVLGAARQPLSAVLAPGRIAAFGGALAWQQAQWQAPAAAGAPPRWQLQARIEPLQVAPWLVRLQPQFGWRGDLSVAGSIDVRSGAAFDADVVLERRAGDLALTVEGATRALGLDQLRLALAAHGGRWQFTQAVQARGVGVIEGQQTVTDSVRAAWPGPDAPLAGGLNLQLSDLGVSAPWLPLGWRLGGQLRLGATLGGRFAAPEYRGLLSGQDLALRNLFEGIHLRQGTLAVALTGTDARIDNFEFRDSSGGLLRVSGGARFGQAPRVQLRASAERLRALDRFDRRIVLSGAADLELQAGRSVVRGDFTIDEGLVDATQADAPASDADVRVIHRAPLPGAPLAGGAANDAAGPQGAVQSPLGDADVDLRVDLGQALRLRGRGLDTLLRGRLRVSTPQGQLAVNGRIDAAGGTYTAYGQNLRIERGNLLLRGDVSTPQLDILALRADIDTRVGVVVTGSVINPRVRLYSEPALGQMDTLTWLLLGRAPEGVGRDDAALLQRAALALLAGERGGDGLVQKLGLDELSISRANGSDGTVGDTILSLGKQLSRRIYVGYEQALGAAGGTLQLIYRVAGRLTLRARTGADNAIDAIWTWRWD